MGNFQRVHIDYAVLFQNHNFFVLLDAYPKWSEFEIIREASNTEKTILLVQNDNATIFQRYIFRHFCMDNGIIQKLLLQVIQPQMDQPKGTSKL